MEYRIVEKPSFTVAGKAIRVSMKDGENTRRIPQFWEECVRDGTLDRLFSLGVQEGVLGAVLLGVCADFDENMGEFTYLVAVESSAGGADAPDFVVRSVPAARWAVFETVGPVQETIQPLWQRIFAEFFPSEPYRRAEGPDLEVFPPGNPMDADYHLQVWLPVAAKE